MGKDFTLRAAYSSDIAQLPVQSISRKNKSRKSREIWTRSDLEEAENVYHNNLQGVNIVKRQIRPQMQPNSGFLQLFWSK